MRCFNHPEKEAVGICKNCFKGICHECLRITKYGISCKDICSDKLELMGELNEDSSTSIKEASRFQFYSQIIILLVGILAASIGIYFIITKVSTIIQ